MMLSACLILMLLEITQCANLVYQVREGQKPFTLVGDIAADIQFMNTVQTWNSKNLITFKQLQDSENLDHKKLFNVSKSGKIYTTETLDAETLCKYNTECFQIVEVAVRKKQSFIKILEVKIIIIDINDNSPEFPFRKVRLEFYETDGKNTTKSIPNAFDRDVGLLNSKIVYHLKKHIDEPFSLSTSKRVVGNSKLVIILQGKLDREMKDSYSLQIIAKDSGTPSKQDVLDVEITVTDENDNAPVFSQNIYNVSVNKAHQIGKPAVILSTKDLDLGKNAEVTYHFDSKTSVAVKNFFKLNSETGEIFLSKNFPLDKRQTYKLFIDATDSGNPPLSSTAIVLINVLNQQNNAPVIDVNFVSDSKGAMLTISEGVEVGSFIAYIKVTDKDAGRNGEVTCNLRHDKLQLKSLGRGKFKVVVKSPVDRETEKRIDINISCRDNGSPSLMTERKFTIEVNDVNDVKPQFTKTIFRFLTYENEEPNFPVGFINATDPDLGPGGQLSYSLLTKMKDALPFEISNYGFISTTKSLDREKQDLYKFKVLVRDNGTPSLNNTANVVVEVMDENDNAPYFTFPSVNPFKLNVHYNPESPSDITILKAMDKDIRENAFLRYEILGGNENRLFTLTPYTGVLFFSRSIKPKDSNLYRLLVAVKDSGAVVLSATTTLSLRLTATNKTIGKTSNTNTISDSEISIKLGVIIVVAAVTISLTIIVSIAMCMVQNNPQRNIYYNRSASANNTIWGHTTKTECFCDQIPSHYDSPSTKTTIVPRNDSYHLMKFRREPCSRYLTNSFHRKDLSGFPCQATTEVCPQTDRGSDKEAAICAPYSELSLMYHTDEEQGFGTGDIAHYEELPGSYSHQTFQVTPQSLTISQQTLPISHQSIPVSHQTQSISQQTLPVNQNKLNALNSSAKCNSPRTTSTIGRYIYHTNSSNELNAFKTGKPVSRTNSCASCQSWNLPVKNTFTSYTKPLPAVPKDPCL
ncbi:protocadherin beta-15-like [Octopus sinensis]|uniref:Protocadherin beta-15-like n=2 Tax=Octopus TaxID=6643 RepID=A0A6P7T2C9_9MOLL|nr:protocadherin beta-15-like [Octopus sinensis]XP_036364457.1 protocadherin beta-15-like [Octopus sinensis]